MKEYINYYFGGFSNRSLHIYIFVVFRNSWNWKNTWPSTWKRPSIRCWKTIWLRLFVKLSVRPQNYLKHILYKIQNFHFIPYLPGLEQFDENTIMRIASILDTNAFEIRPFNRHGSKVRAIFLEAAMLSHNCVPNTRHVFDKNMQLTIHANGTRFWLLNFLIFSLNPPSYSWHRKRSNNQFDLHATIKMYAWSSWSFKSFQMLWLSMRTVFGCKWIRHTLRCNYMFTV